MYGASRKSYLTIIITAIVIGAALVFCMPSQAFSLQSGQTADSNALQGSTTEVLAPGKAVFNSFWSNAAGGIRATTKSVANADGYQFVIASDKNLKHIVKRSFTTSRAVQFGGLATDKRYYGAVRAYRLVNGKKVWGKWSSVRSATTRKVRIGVVGSTSSGAGGWLRRNGCTVVRINKASFNVNNYDGLVIPGGGDVDPALYGQKRNPHDYGIDRKLDLLQIAVIKKFVKAGKPVIGICRGTQILNVALGGTLKQHIPGWHTGRRTVKIKKNSWLYSLFGSSESVSHSHHQCVAKLGKGMIATEWDARDKNIEAIQHETLPVYGLQWHPEGMGSRGSQVARRFMSVCVAYANKAHAIK